ncbi:MAG: type VI secretion system baseplate subunit TssF [Nitrospirae bacterium]|nr:type VI secretion system baseplate subunit TssF [Nitrospirota bacterium]
MDDKLLNYYEQELTFIRKMGVEFAKKYPKLAGRLLLEPDKCEDPFTERLIEAFAFLSARIHNKIDDDFPEITESLLGILYPHYTNPIPSMSIVRFEPVRQNIPEAGYKLNRNTMLYSKPVGGTPCQFTTSYPVTLWPVEVVSASLQDLKRPVKDARQVISIQMKSFNNINFSQMNWEGLRFYLNGPHQHIYHLYELLFNNVCHVECEYKNKKGVTGRISLSPDDIRPVGFGPGEIMLPYTSRSFPGYLLLFEYFCFPEKFLFFDLGGLGQFKKHDMGDTLDIWIYINKEAKSTLAVNKDTFCLNATPVINLFKRIAEPVRVEQMKTSYPVIPDIRRREATEIFTIDRVSASSTSSPGKEIEFSPFYSIKHHLDEDYMNIHRAYWYTQRQPSGKKGDNGTEVSLHFADLDFDAIDPDAEILTIHATCSNRDLPARLPFGDPAGDFDLEIAAPVSRINCLLKPTPSRRPSLGGALQWRLISHLSLNYLSIVQGGEDALKEILRLYDFDNSPSTRQQINGITSIQSQYATKRVGMSFARGVRVTVELDEDKFVGAGLYLFASVLQRFLGQYVSVNSFSQLIVKTIQRKEVLKEWAPLSGNQVLL